MKRVAVLASIVLIFVSFNAILYVSVTRRLKNNLGQSNQIKMIDVGKYLPFEEGSELADVDSSLKFDSSDDLPVLDGAAALVPVYASVIDNCYPEGSVTYEGGTFSDDNTYGENFADDSVMQYQNTIRGFNAVVDGTTDIFFSAYPSEDQLKYAEEKGVELEIVPVGYEAFVFFVNGKNPVSDLTVDQIRSIYRGKITNWEEVGGPDRSIDPILRIEDSGRQTMMEKFMEGDMITKRENDVFWGASIGYSFRFYLSGIIGNDNVKMLKVNGVYPDAENIRNRTYPITANFYIIYRKDNTNPNVSVLRDWILSDEGQKLIEDCGYVGL